MNLFLAVRRVILLQVLAIAGAAALGLAYKGKDDAISALLGGLVGFIPNLYFSFKFGRADPEKPAKNIVQDFYSGEVGKLVLTALLFVIVFQLPGIHYMPLFMSFIAVIMVFWFALFSRN
jgi:ATP synthase protein I